MLLIQHHFQIYDCSFFARGMAAWTVRENVSSKPWTSVSATRVGHCSIIHWLLESRPKSSNWRGDLELNLEV